MSKECEIKAKMMQEQKLQLKMIFFWVITGISLISGGGIDSWWGGNKNLVGRVYWGDFSRQGEYANFWQGGTPPIIIASRENLDFTNTCYNKHPLKYFQENTHVMSKILKSF